MKNKLVYSRDGEALCDSREIAEKFGKQHQNILKKIDNLMADLALLDSQKLVAKEAISTEVFIEKIHTYRGQDFRYFEMNRPAFSLFVMGFTGKKALSWKRKFNDAFYQMEQLLLASELNQQSKPWLTLRKQTKSVRKTETDTIKDFVEYATAQGSTNANFYYKHVTMACYKCLQLIQHKQPKLRETLDLLELHQLMLAEVVAERSLRKWMAEKEHYKAIFVLVKQDLEQFAGSLMLDFHRKLEEKI